MNSFIWFVSIVLAAARILGAKSQSYQAIAHLWVGYLVGLWYALRQFECIQFQLSIQTVIYSFIFLCVIEVACFILTKKNVSPSLRDRLSSKDLAEIKSKKTLDELERLYKKSVQNTEGGELPTMQELVAIAKIGESTKGQSDYL
jgi:hypothetical protein